MTSSQELGTCCYFLILYNVEWYFCISVKWIWQWGFNKPSQEVEYFYSKNSQEGTFWTRLQKNKPQVPNSEFLANTCNLHNQHPFISPNSPFVEIAQLSPRSACHVKQEAFVFVSFNTIIPSSQYNSISRMYVGTGKTRCGLKLKTF